MRLNNCFILILLCAVAAGLYACGGSQGYTIEGKDQGEGFAVLHRFGPNVPDIRDTVVLENGCFKFTGEVDDVVMGEVLVCHEGEQPQRYSLYLENSHLTLKDGKFTGGPNNDFMIDMDDAFASVDTAAVNYRELMLKAFNDCCAAHPDVEAAAFMYYVFNRETPLDAYEEGFNKFTERVQNSLLGSNAREEIAARKATRQGIEAPAFSLNDREGNPISLESLRGQYVLLDFWASWCKPCRASMPGLKELYARYHEKGFEILGISSDTKEDAWKKAVEDDQTPWIHVIDAAQAEGAVNVAQMYGVRSIPTFFLIDKEGKIVGKMDHDSLADKLGEIFE